MKITQNLRMQNKIKWKNYFKIQTSSFSVKHLQTRNIAIRFLPPRDGEDETDLYAQRISRRIVCKRKKKKKKENLEREKEHDPVTEPSHDRHFHQRGGSRARCPVSSIPETNIQGFLKSGRCMPWKSITSATRYV